jgi:hypothetical protein
MGDCLLALFILSGLGSLFGCLKADPNFLAISLLRKSPNVPNVSVASYFPNLVSFAFRGRHSWMLSTGA